MFFGALSTYLVGRIFYDTAARYQQSRWAFAIIGVVVYFAGIFTGYVLVTLIGEAISPGIGIPYPDKTIVFMGSPIGFIVCRIAYVRLKKSWSKPKEIPHNTLDSDLISPNANK